MNTLLPLQMFFNVYRDHADFALIQPYWVDWPIGHKTPSYLLTIQLLNTY